MKQIYKQTIIIVILITIILSSAYYLQRLLAPKQEYAELRKGEPDITQKPRSNLWFQKQEDGRIYAGPYGVSMSINYHLEDNETDIVDVIYVNMAVDLYNDSIYIAVSDTSPESLIEFKETITIPPTTSIHFILAPAPLAMLEEWLGIVKDSREELKDSGVNITKSSISINGTIQVGVQKITDERVSTLLEVLEGKVPPGILSIYNGTPSRVYPFESIRSKTVSIKPLIGFHGYLAQKLHPEIEHIDGEPGIFAVTLEVFDPEIGFTGEHLYLLNETGGYYLMGVNTKPLPEDFFMFFGPRPIQVMGQTSNRTSIHGYNISALQFVEINYSGFGAWCLGNLSTMVCNLQPYTLLNRQYNGYNHTYLSFKHLDEEGQLIEEILLASHEGTIYDVPYCATLQPIAKANTGDTIMIYGLLTQLTEENGDSQKVLMIYQVRNLSKTPARPH